MYLTQATLAKPQTQLPEHREIRKGNFFLGICQFVLLLVVLLVALDFVLTIAGVADEEHFDIEPVTGWTLIPGREFTYRSEGYAHNKYNSMGMHDVERMIEKPADTLRIGVLGCSLTQAKEVSLDENYCRLVEKELNEQRDGRYEILNFAVSAYSIPQEYLRLKTLALRFHPDLIVFTVRPNSLLYMGHDPKGGFINARPHFALSQDGKLIEDRSYQKYWLNSRSGKRMQQMRWMRIHSRLYSVYGRSITALEAFFRSPPSVAAFFGSKKTIAGTGLGHDGTSVKAREYLGRTAAGLIKDAKALCDKNDCRFILMYMPTSKGKRTAQEDEIFRAIAAQQKLPYLDLNERFDELEKNTNRKFYFKDHMTKDGHSEVAAVFKQFLKANGFLNLSRRAKSPEAAVSPNVN